MAAKAAPGKQIRRSSLDTFRCVGYKSADAILSVHLQVKEVIE